jgi:antitoxin YefM
MNAITCIDLKQNLEIYIDKILKNNEALMISKQNNEKVVLISENEYNSLVETNYLMSNAANADHLMTSIAQHKAGKVISKELYADE